MLSKMTWGPPSKAVIFFGGTDLSNLELKYNYRRNLGSWLKVANPIIKVLELY